MMKKIIFVILFAGLLSSCGKDDYVSRRHHKEDSQVNFESKIQKDNNSIHEVSAVYVSEKSSGNTGTVSERELYHVEDTTNLRMYPSTDSDIIKEISPYEDIILVEDKGDWALVTVGEYRGYILKELLN